MPISLKHLRHDATCQAALRQSIFLRKQQQQQPTPPIAPAHTNIDAVESKQSNDDNDNDDIVRQVLMKDAEYGNALRQVEACRSRRRKKDPTAKAEELQILERVLEETQLNVQEALCQLPNYVDIDISPDDHDFFTKDEDKKTQGGTTIARVHDEPPNSRRKDNSRSRQLQEDVLFCIGGYEYLDHETVVWTDAGCELQQAFQRAWEEWLLDVKQQQQQHQQRHPLPDVNLDQEQSTTLMTTLRQWRFPASVMEVNNSAWEAVLHSMKGTSLYDRVLPQCHLVYSCGSSTNQNIDKVRRNGGKLLLQPEQKQEQQQPTNGPQSSSRKQQPGKRKQQWYEDIQSEVVEGVFLTGPSLTADSRPLQLHWMKVLQSFYHSLIVTRTSTTNEEDIGHNESTSCTHNQWTDIVAVPPSELDPSEASRLVLLGKQPSTHEMIELAYMSNLQDFCSLDIRHGNSTLQSVRSSSTTTTCTNNGSSTKAVTMVAKWTASVHVVRGLMSRHSNSIAWMLAWNKKRDDDSKDDKNNNTSNSSYVVIPPRLQKHMPLHHAKTIPFVRRRRVSINGKHFVEQLTSTNPSPATRKNRDDQNGSAITFSSTTQQRLSKEQIHMEALSCPFFFLPFFFKQERDLILLDENSAKNRIR